MSSISGASSSAHWPLATASTAGFSADARLHVPVLANELCHHRADLVQFRTGVRGAQDRGEQLALLLGMVHGHAVAEHLQEVLGHGTRLGRGRDEFRQVERGVQLRHEVMVALGEIRERTVDVMDGVGCIGVRHTAPSTIWSF
nr:hypothetical protein [Ramlibacter montanisoli]